MNCNGVMRSFTKIPDKMTISFGSFPRNFDNGDTGFISSSLVASFSLLLLLGLAVLELELELSNWP